MKILTLLHEDQFDEPPKAHNHLDVLTHQRDLLTTILDRMRSNPTISHLMINNPLIKRIFHHADVQLLKPNELEVSGYLWRPKMFTKGSRFRFPDTLPESRMILSFWRKLEHVVNQLAKVKQQISTLTQQANKKALTDLKSTELVTTIPITDIPYQIPFTKLMTSGQLRIMTSLNNPYFTRASTGGRVDRYAGSPAHFPWTRIYKSQYLKLLEILSKSNIPPPNIMYAATGYDASNNIDGMAFIVTTADKRIVWHLEIGGQNRIHVDGRTLKMSKFLQVPATRLTSIYFKNWITNTTP